MPDPAVIGVTRATVRMPRRVTVAAVHSALALARPQTAASHARISMARL